MANRDETLREHTHKGDGIDVGMRVYYTLTDNRETQGQRTTKAVALLVARLHAAGTLDATAVDDLLLECLS